MVNDDRICRDLYVFKPLFVGVYFICSAIEISCLFIFLLVYVCVIINITYKRMTQKKKKSLVKGSIILL